MISLAPYRGVLASRELLAHPGRRRGADGSAPVRRVADVLAKELGWSEERVRREVALFKEEARSEGLVGS